MLGRTPFLTLVATAAVALAAVPAAANNTVAATNAAAIDGSFGLAISMDGSGNNAFVRDLSPNDESLYRASFKIDMNNLTMNDGDWHFVATWRAEPGGPAALPSPRNLMRILVRFRQGQVNPYKVRVVCRNDSGAWAQPGGHSLPPSGSSTFTVEWQQSSGPGVNDGFCRFYRNGVLRAESTTLDSDQWGFIGSAALGVSAVDAGTSGSIYMDTFESFRTLLP